jgi:hypothetical protein
MESLDKLTLNFISYLENHSEYQICEFKTDEGVMSHEFLIWEKKNQPNKLPTDLKQYEK